MIPLYSDKTLSRIPFMTLLILSVNISVFFYQLTGQGSINQSVVMYGMIPYDLFNPGKLVIHGRLPSVLTIITSMFMHGGFLHLGGNMLYLWVFGRNVEDDFGHLRFLVFYLITGIIATIAFAVAFPAGQIPLVGASGAIAGILGVYFLRFPASRIYCLVIFFIFVRVIALPAFILLGLWFVIQIASSMTNVSATAGSSGHGGVAWISHVTGFVVGIVWTIWELRRRYYMKMGRR